MQSPSPRVRDLLTEKFHALLDDCDLIAEHSAYGETFDAMEVFFLIQGRTFLREVFQNKLQERIEQSETTSEAKQCPHCKKNALPIRRLCSRAFSFCLYPRV